MSKVDKLLIQGVRSFGYREGEQAVVVFNTPLTIIVGQNGAGKTTIIECLKYATTGEIPPMSKGGAFIYDPKLASETEIKAKVKLQFRDRAGNKTVVSRIMQATQKPSKIETRTLDSSMEKLVDGKKVQVTSRCADMDEEMMLHLGVSKAVLNAVLFCHQEDSTWPLSEGKVLKKKFDEIFDASKYSKALENVKDIIQSQNQESRGFVTELGYLSDLKKKADEYHEDLRLTEQKVEQQRRIAERAEKDLEPVDRRLQELDSMFDEVTEMEKHIASLKSRKEQIEMDSRELKKKLKGLRRGTVAELKRMHSDYDAQLDAEKRHLQKVLDSLAEVNAERQMLEERVAQFWKEQQEILLEAESHKRQVKERDGLVVSLAKQLSLKGYVAEPFDVRQVGQFLQEMESRTAQMRRAADEEKASFEHDEAALQKRVDALIMEIASFEQTVKLRSRQKDENAEKMREISRNLKTISASSAALVNLEEDLRTAEEELAEHASSVDIPSLEAQLSELQSEKGRLDERARALQEELAKVTKQAAARGAVDALRKQKRTVEEEMSNKQASVEGDAVLLFDCMPPAAELERKLDDLVRAKRAELEAASDKLRHSRERLSQNQTTRSLKEKDLKGLKEKMSRLEGQLHSVCGGQSYEEAVQANEAELTKVQEDLVGTRGSEPFFKMCVGKVKQTNKCPVCIRKFDTQSDVDRCIANLSQRVSNAIPRIVAQLQEKLQSLQQKQKHLQGLTQVIREMTDLRTHQIPQLESSLSQLSSEVSRMKDEVAQHEATVSELNKMMARAQKLRPEAALLAQRSSQLEKLEHLIQKEEARLPSSARGSSRSHQVVDKDFKEAQAKCDEINRKMDRRRNEIDENQSQRRSLEQEVHDLREKKLKYREQVSRKVQLEEQRAELLAKNEAVDRELQEVSAQLEPMKAKKAELDLQRAKLNEDKQQALSASISEVADLEQSRDRVSQLNSGIQRFTASGRESMVDQYQGRVDEANEQKRRLDQERGSLEGEKNELQEKLSKAELGLREIEDSLQLAQRQEDTRQLQLEIEDKEQQLRIRGFVGYEQEYHSLQKERDELTKKKGKANGACEGLELQVVRLRRELNEERLKNAEKNFVHMKINIGTVKAGVSDVEKLYRALDRAIMRYHQAKMDEINEYIRDLWLKIYKGSDIDRVEIRSEDDMEEESRQRQRRTYKYRVVMVKGSHRMDMRGRCSAGQKMLASIIIRLALAETFSYECGVLALDEPTTNLDDDNKEGLAQALADIVKDRRVQKNFQLIVITHDSEFVDMLGRSQFVDDFYEVSKNRDGISSVRRKSFAADWK